jgi:hypothetical protein
MARVLVTVRFSTADLVAVAVLGAVEGVAVTASVAVAVGVAAGGAMTFDPHALRASRPLTAKSTIMARLIIPPI